MKINQPSDIILLSMLLVPKHENLGCFYHLQQSMSTIVNSIDFNKGCLMNYNRLQQDGYVRAVRNIKSVDHAKHCYLILSVHIQNSVQLIILCNSW